MLAYKRTIVTLSTALPAGEIRALLRREGLYQFPEPGPRLSDDDRLVAGSATGDMVPPGKAKAYTQSAARLLGLPHGSARLPTPEL